MPYRPDLHLIDDPEQRYREQLRPEHLSYKEIRELAVELLDDEWFMTALASSEFPDETVFSLVADELPSLSKLDQSKIARRIVRQLGMWPAPVWQHVAASLTSILKRTRKQNPHDELRALERDMQFVEDLAWEGRIDHITYDDTMDILQTEIEGLERSVQKRPWRATAAQRGDDEMKVYQFNGALYREADQRRDRGRQALEGDQESIEGVGDTGLVYPVYQSEKDQEREQIEALFSLGGGELMDAAWLGHAYWYEGAPEWDEDFREEDDYQYRTVIEWSHFAPEENEVQTDEEGVEWEVVKWYGAPTETDCWVCGHGSDAFENGFRETYDREPGPGDECGLCEYKFEDMPGYIYDGEAHEVLFRTHNRNIWPEDYSDEEEFEPAEDDAFMEPTGQLGSQISLAVEGKHLGTFDDQDEAKQTLRDWAEQNNVYHNLWFIDDHGGVNGPIEY